MVLSLAERRLARRKPAGNGSTSTKGPFIWQRFGGMWLFRLPKNRRTRKCKRKRPGRCIPFGRSEPDAPNQKSHTSESLPFSDPFAAKPKIGFSQIDAYRVVSPKTTSCATSILGLAADRFLCFRLCFTKSKRPWGMHGWRAWVVRVAACRVACVSGMHGRIRVRHVWPRACSACMIACVHGWHMGGARSRCRRGASPCP